jgi:L-methionine (R)-S-oxide reductase
MTPPASYDSQSVMTDAHDWNSTLAGILAEFGCQTGTIHQSEDGKNLTLVCQIGVPDALLDKVNFIPFGKGIAGAAAERMEAVELCNLQQDLGGVAKPDARQTGVSGSVAVPIFSPSTKAVIGTLGIGKFTPHEFSPAELARLHEISRQLAPRFLA